MHWPPFSDEAYSSPSGSPVIETKASPGRKIFSAALAGFVTLYALAFPLVSETRGQAPDRVDLTIGASPSLGLVGKVSVTALQTDGKVIVGGSFSRGIVRLNADSTLDTSFDVNVSGYYKDVLSVAIQPDGKILLGGYFDTVNGAARAGLARLNADGTLDASFNAPTNGLVNSIALQPDGRILVGGSFSSQGRVNIARLLADGSVDTGFNATIDGTEGTVHSVALQADGRILIGGTFYSIDGGYYSPLLARLNTDGSADQNFQPGVMLFFPGSFVGTLAVQRDGKIIVGGNFLGIGGEARSGIARLNENGTLDAHFKNTGVDLYSGVVRAVAVQGDDKIIVCGNFDHVNGVARTNIARLNANGTLDLVFAVNPGPDGGVSGVAVQSDGRLVISGAFTQVDGMARNSIARINPDGTVEPTFRPDSARGPNAAIRKLVVQGDGKILVNGDFSSVNGVIFNELARLNANGAVDTSFHSSSNFNSSHILGGDIRAIAAQSDGKALAAGYFTQVNGTPHKGLVRLNNDGTVDNNFNVSLDFFDTGGGSGSALAIQTNGRILIAGYFDYVNGVHRYNIARLYPDGSLDTSFDAGTTTPRIPETLTVQADGRILFSYPNTIAGSGLRRLNSDGSRDAGFNVSLEPGPLNLPKRVLAVAIQSGDTKIVIGGLIGLVDGVARDSIARLNADGSLDPDFNASILAREDPIYGPIPGIISALAIQADGKIVIGGDFALVNDVPHTDIARLNADGSLDSTFNVTLSGFNPSYSSYPVTTVEVQNDGKILVGGEFTIVNGVVRNYAARLNSDGSVDRSFIPGTRGGRRFEDMFYSPPLMTPGPR